MKWFVGVGIAACLAVMGCSKSQAPAPQNAPGAVASSAASAQVEAKPAKMIERSVAINAADFDGNYKDPAMTRFGLDRLMCYQATPCTPVDVKWTARVKSVDGDRVVFHQGEGEFSAKVPPALQPLLETVPKDKAVLQVAGTLDAQGRSIDTSDLSVPANASEAYFDELARDYALSCLQIINSRDVQRRMSNWSPEKFIESTKVSIDQANPGKATVLLHYLVTTNDAFIKCSVDAGSPVALGQSTIADATFAPIALVDTPKSPEAAALWKQEAKAKYGEYVGALAMVLNRHRTDESNYRAAAEHCLSEQERTSSAGNEEEFVKVLGICGRRAKEICEAGVGPGSCGAFLDLLKKRPDYRAILLR